MKTRLTAFLAAALPAAVAFSAPAKVNSPLESTGLKFEPMIAWVRLAPGESQDLQFALRNTSANTAVFSGKVRDTQLEKDGGRTFGAAGTAKQGAGAWISITDTRIVSKPGSDFPFTARVKAPADAASGNYYGAVMMELETLGGKPFEVASHEEQLAEGIGAGFKVHMAIALTVHVDVRRPTDPVPTPVIEAVSDQVIPQDAAKPVSVEIKLHNPSSWEVRPMGSLLILDSSGKPVGKADFDDSVQLWPNDTRPARATYSTLLAPGSYQAVAVLTVKDPFDPTGVGIYKPSTIRRKLKFEIPAAPAASGAGKQGN